MAWECKDCKKEVYVDVNMVMIKDELWEKIADKHLDVYCDCCIEKRLGRPISVEDFKTSTMGLNMIPCNVWWLKEQKEKGKTVPLTIREATQIY